MNKITIILLFAIVSLVFNCQHARIRFNPKEITPKTEEVPPACKPPIRNKKECDKQTAELKEKIAKEEEERKNRVPPVHIYKQRFFLWGFYPSQIQLDISQVCPEGINEIDQYTDWIDEVLSQVSLGMYYPRTLKVRCF